MKTIGTSRFLILNYFSKSKWSCWLFKNQLTKYLINSFWNAFFKHLKFLSIKRISTVNFHPTAFREKEVKIENCVFGSKGSMSKKHLLKAGKICLLIGRANFARLTDFTPALTLCQWAPVGKLRNRIFSRISSEYLK